MVVLAMYSGIGDFRHTGIQPFQWVEKQTWHAAPNRSDCSITRRDITALEEKPNVVAAGAEENLLVSFGSGRPYGLEERMFHISGEMKQRAPYGNSDQDPVQTMRRHLRWALGSATGALLTSIVTTIDLVELN